ncbi:magnesium transporter [Enterovibrio nigricans]|uniref:Divalent cation transporter n=1 Tax=Enterovibrio nigricans DSM 22720 TaxID=1121868 RepID=A0A1T4TSZ6_9GAMM|nr:magnesium transporter [Enterovibrio nigricans]PKF51897.1 magnesium transporter [Enterovibrio nigricans]SKA43461.1 Divalent cation transporter [Enterovibrio nigricans DSM 22720]
MTVMNTIVLGNQTQKFATKEIQAAKSAFLFHDEKDRVRLLTVMPINEAIAVLNSCPLALVRNLLDSLAEEGDTVRSRHLATGLGLISSEAEPDGNYLANSVIAHVRQRIGWIVGLALLGIVSGMIISHYEDTIAQLVLLAIYLPVVAAAGGNTGSQAATLVVRALAMNEIRPHQWLTVMWKEIRIAVVIAIALAIVVMLRVLLFSDASVLPSGIDLDDVALAIGLALVIQVTLSTTLGALLPLIARKMRLDPAVLVSPVLASIVDISGMAIYFVTINAWLGLM